MGRALAEWEAARAAATARRTPQRVPRPPFDRTAIVLGKNENAVPVILPARARLEHAHAIGTTGGGKSKFLEVCIRQDIIAGRGVCVVDPHGNHHDSMYRSILGWLDHSKLLDKRTVHLVDPNAPTHTTGFNPLARPDDETDLSVIADFCLDAFARAWGNENMKEKPTITRVITATFMALAELGLTLCEAELLYDPYDESGVRTWAIDHVRDRYARRVLLALHQLATESKRDFRAEVVGPMNRLAAFVRSEAIRTTVGQTEHMLDMREALDEGHIILVNLSGGRHVSDGDTALLGRLLTRCLLFHATRRQKPYLPYFVYLDECHRYLSGDLENILAEVRKYGVGMVLSHQWQEQLKVESDNMLAAVRNATNLKAVFRLKDSIEAEDLAQMVVPLDLEMPVNALIKPTVVGNRRVWLDSESRSEQRATSDMSSLSTGTTVAETDSYAESVAETSSEGESSSLMRATSASDGTSQMSFAGVGSGVSAGEMMTPETGWLAMPTVVGMSEGASAMTSAGQGASLSAMRGRSSGSGRTTSTARGHAYGQTQGRALSRGISKAQSSGQAETRGTSTSRGQQEGFEPIYESLPSAVHGKEAMLYFAAQTLRNLTTGTAFINFVDAGGMKAAHLTIPDSPSFAPAPAAFEELRDRVFAASPSALPIQAARDHVADRERALIAKAQLALSPPEPETATGYRVKKARPEMLALEALQMIAAEEPEEPRSFRIKKKRLEKPVS